MPQPDTGRGFSDVARTAPFWFLTMAHFICGIGCGFMTTHIVIFATDAGFSDMIAASLLSIQGGLNIVGVLVTGHLGDRIARKHVLALTHFVRGMSFATIVIFIWLGSSSLLMLYVAMGFFGFGWFTTAPLTAGLVADLFGSLRMGTILGVTTSSHILGFAIGGYAGGAVFDLTGSYHLVFITQALLAAIATLLSLAIKQKPAL
jgi:MFS family permease